MRGYSFLKIEKERKTKQSKQKGTNSFTQKTSVKKNYGKKNMSMKYKFEQKKLGKSKRTKEEKY